MEINHVMDVMESIRTCLDQPIAAEGLMDVLLGDSEPLPPAPKCPYIPF